MKYNIAISGLLNCHVRNKFAGGGPGVSQCRGQVRELKPAVKPQAEYLAPHLSAVLLAGFTWGFDPLFVEEY